MKTEGTLLLTRSDVARLLTLDECIAAVEHAFQSYAEGRTLLPGILGFPSREGGFHIKAAGLDRGRPYFAVKVNGNFFRNTARYGMPNIQGIVVLCDAENGYPLALMDSIEITILRTGAATAVAAKHLARADARVVTICGCGNQGRIQLRALARVRPIERAYAFDSDANRAQGFARELSGELGIEVSAVRNLADAVRQCHICVTSTPSRQPFLEPGHVAEGTFVAAVGADSAEKQELDPRLLASNKVVVDLLGQCATIGELHHALEQGLITKTQVHAELGDVVAGRKPGRTSEDEIIIFDSTGTAVQDVAAAAVVYENATREGRAAALNLLE